MQVGQITLCNLGCVGSSLSRSTLVFACHYADITTPQHHMHRQAQARMLYFMLCLGKLSNGCSWSCPQLKGWHMLTCLSCLAMDSTNGISGPKPSTHSVVCVYFSLSPFFDFLCPLGLCLLYIIAPWGQSSWQEAHRLIGTPGVSW